MTEKPELSDGHARIANEIMDALARTPMSSYESQCLWFIFRKTYGWGKKDDWISLSQFVEATGISKPHVCRALRLLAERRIITKGGNESLPKGATRIGFNKYHSQWRALPKGATTHKALPKGATIVTERGNQPLPKGAPTKESFTKETIQKKEPEKEFSEQRTKEDDIKLKELYARAAEEFGLCDVQYLDKLWDQGLSLKSVNRREFVRKATLLVTWSRIPSQHKRVMALHGEIAGMVNDKTFFERQGPSFANE